MFKYRKFHTTNNVSSKYEIKVNKPSEQEVIELDKLKKIIKLYLFLYLLCDLVLLMFLLNYIYIYDMCNGLRYLWLELSPVCGSAIKTFLDFIIISEDYSTKDHCGVDTIKSKNVLVNGFVILILLVIFFLIRYKEPNPDPSYKTTKRYSVLCCFLTFILIIFSVPEYFLKISLVKIMSCIIKAYTFGLGFINYFNFDIVRIYISHDVIKKHTINKFITQFLKKLLIFIYLGIQKKLVL